MRHIILAMTDSDDDESSTFLRTDAVGRVLRTRAQRNAILDAFENSSLSGPEFARVHELNYQTFATWRQARKREAEEQVQGTAFTLIEATKELPTEKPDRKTPSSSGLSVELSCGAMLRANDSLGVSLAVDFLMQWKRKETKC